MSQAAALPPAVVFDVDEQAVSSLSFDNEDGLASMDIVVSAVKTVPVLRVVVCRRSKWTVGLSGSQTQACGHISQNKLDRSIIRHRRSPRIMFNQLGSKCSSMLLWHSAAAAAHHHHPSQEVCNLHCYGLGTGASTHGRSTNKKAAGTDVRARTKASLNPHQLGIGRVSTRCADANPRNIPVSLGCQPGLACRQDFHRWMVTTCACRFLFL